MTGMTLFAGAFPSARRGQFAPFHTEYRHPLSKALETAFAERDKVRIVQIA